MILPDFNKANGWTVNVQVSQTGSFGATGASTVTVNSATTTYTIQTTDDNTDEPDGSVTATIQSGTGYTIGMSNTATVQVSDNDAPKLTTEPTSVYVKVNLFRICYG